MALITITGGQTFPEGTSVSAYPRTAWPAWQPPSGAPSGSPVATGTVTGGTVTFSGLNDGTDYVAYASSIDRRKHFTVPPVSAESSSRSGPGGTWASWLLGAGEPGMASAQSGAAEYHAASNTTFFSYLGPSRQIWVGAFRHATKTIVGPVKVADSLISPDDAHGFPSLALDGAGYIHVVGGVHNQAVRWCKSAAPLDVTGTWAVGSGPTGTYHMIDQDPATGDLYMTYRAGTTHGVAFPNHEWGGLAKLTLGGGAWADVGSGIVDTTTYNGEVAKDFYPGGVAFVGTRFWFVFCVAHGAVHDGPRSDIFLAYYDLTDGHLRAADGTDLGTRIDSLAKLTSAKVATRTLLYQPRMLATTNSDIVLCWQTQTGDSKIGTETAKWNGSTWTITDTGARSNYMFLNPGLRKSSTGYELFVTAGRDTETVVLHPSNELVAYIGQGHDVLLYTSPDAVTWTSQGTIVRRQSIKGQGVGGVDIPRRAADGFKAMVFAATTAGLPAGNASILALTDKEIDPLLVAQRQPRGPVEQRIKVITVANSQAPSASSAFRSHSVATMTPENCTHILIRVDCRGAGAGATGSTTAKVRMGGQSGTGETHLDIEASVRAEFTDAQLFEGWVQVNQARTIEFSADSTKVATYSIVARGYRCEAAIP